jgi:hypothetical protein
MVWSDDTAGSSGADRKRVDVANPAGAAVQNYLPRKSAYRNGPILDVTRDHITHLEESGGRGGGDSRGRCRVRTGAARDLRVPPIGVRIPKSGSRICDRQLS